jgi:hypothetical protein
MSKKPWEFHGDLSSDRLPLVAKVLTDVRNETVLQHDPASGDTSWSLGCRVYARTAELLTRAAGTLFPWMRVINPPLEFIFCIGDVPVRFFHGDADHLAAHHLRIAAMENHQLDFAFGDNRIDLVWRIVVESDAAGLTDKTVLIGSSHVGEVQCDYEIPPLSDTVAFLDPLKSTTRPGIELPAPVVSARRDGDLKKQDDSTEI